MPILVLIFGVETWVVTPLIVRVLGRFQDQDHLVLLTNFYFRDLRLP